MSRASLPTALLCALLAGCASAPRPPPVAAPLPKRLFQTEQGWSPRVNLAADMMLAYGLDASLPARIADWRAHGYRVGFMTGVAWGHYPDYLRGDIDGRPHWDETQQAAGGRLLLHDGRDTPYFVPTGSYTAYLRDGVLAALEAGAEAIYLEEPEFWADAGWSGAFRTAWQQHHGTPWQPPDASRQAQQQASQLKVALYRDSVATICRAVHAWADAHARTVPCNVASHSLLNYAQWRIVSPQTAFAGSGIDGLIAQVWTGTARAPNRYRGVQAERTFATAFLEYGALRGLADVVDAPLWLLADPVEDNPAHTWSDYRRNWQATLVASLLHPGNAGYETLPWPNRIFGLQADYPLDGGGRAPIGADYQAELQGVFDALARMPADGQWLRAGSTGIGVLTSDSMLFQRAAPQPSDPLLGDVYGLALPLLLHGMPVAPVPLEAATTGSGRTAPFAGYRLLLLSYHAQLPPSPDTAHALADWVRSGGALLVVDDDGNPYVAGAAVSPRAQLFAALGLDPRRGGTQRVGRGAVTWLRAAPDTLSTQADGSDRLLAAARHTGAAVGLTLQESPLLAMRRGPFVIAAGLAGAMAGQPQAAGGSDAAGFGAGFGAGAGAGVGVGVGVGVGAGADVDVGVDVGVASTTASGGAAGAGTGTSLDARADSDARTLHGRFIDLFDAALPLLPTVTLHDDDQRLLLDLDLIDPRQPQLLLAAGRSTPLQRDGRRLQLRIAGLAARAGRDDRMPVLLALPAAPQAVTLDGTPLTPERLRYDAGLLRLQLPPSADWRTLEIVLPR